MPESVQKWVDTHSYLECRTVQQSILVGYNADMAKYAKPATTVKIRACFNSIPAQLAKENRKFQYKLAMKGGTAKIFGEAIEWLILAGTVHKCKLITHGFIPISAQEAASDAAERPGEGVVAIVGGQRVAVGNQRLMQALGLQPMGVFGAGTSVGRLETYARFPSRSIRTVTSNSLSFLWFALSART